jgi:pimeloyl-ACP methyl ester carboxylesterase
MRRLFLTVDGIKISTLVAEGSKEPVLLIHGNSSCKEIFHAQIRSLVRAGYPAIVPDLPGHGESDDSRSPRATYSFPGYAHMLRRLMKQLGIRRYHVVGWSLGGHIGLELWSRFAEVHSLLITGTPPISLNPLGVSRGFVESPAMNLAGTRVFGPSEVRAYGSAMLGTRIDLRGHLARMIARTDGRARYWMVRNGLSGHGINEVRAVQQCPRPLAIVQGRQDEFINLDHLGRLQYKNLWLREPILLDAGHAPHWQVPVRFNRILKSFLQQVPCQTSTTSKSTTVGHTLGQQKNYLKLKCSPP